MDGAFNTHTYLDRAVTGILNYILIYKQIGSIGVISDTGIKDTAFN